MMILARTNSGEALLGIEMQQLMHKEDCSMAP